MSFATGRSEVARSALFRLLDEGRYPMRVFDVNLRPPDVHLETVRRGLQAATVIKISDEELGGLAAALDLSGEEEELFEVAPSLEWLAVTRAVGAGDAFTGGLVDALVSKRPD